MGLLVQKAQKTELEERIKRINYHSIILLPKVLSNSQEAHSPQRFCEASINLVL